MVKECITLPFFGSSGTPFLGIQLHSWTQFGRAYAGGHHRKSFSRLGVTVLEAFMARDPTLGPGRVAVLDQLIKRLIYR